MYLPAMVQQVGDITRGLSSGLCASNVLEESAGVAGVASASNVLAVGETLALVQGEDLVVDLGEGVVALGGTVAVAWCEGQW